jgi:3-(3-hydroxy-phenyl)propionate hydroxylase
MAPDADPQYVSREDVARERVARMLGADTSFDLVWVGPYSYRTMLMERFRHGRLMFIGDAAHAKSPFGARGGNSGIMDADNLGWRLALVLAGRAQDSLLEHFHIERHRAAQENIRVTGRSGRFLQPRSRNEFRLRRAVLNLARRHDFARSLLNTGRLCTPHHYGGLPTVGTQAQDGKAVPNVALASRGHPSHLVDLLREAGDEPVAFVFGSGKATLVAALAAAGLPVQVRAEGEDFSDPHGLLAAQTGTPPGGVALIRPDSHLAASLAVADPHALVAAARRSLFWNKA